MNHHNLMPSKRLAARRRQKAIRRWVWIDGTAAVVLLVAGVAMVVTQHDTPRPAGAALPVVNEEKLNASLVSLRQECARLKTNLHAVQDLSDGPDWSVLLSVLSRSLGDDVVLSSVDCRVGAPAGIAVSAGTDPTKRLLLVGGLGRSQQAVTQFVLRVESLNLFSSVQLVQSTPQMVNGSECVAFHVVCTFLQATAAGR